MISPYTHAPAVHTGEAATLSRSADSPRRDDSLTPGRLLTAARSLLGFLRDFFGPIELTVGRRRGYVEICSICQRDVHDLGEVCPRQLVADCSGCGQVVDLDRFGRSCPTGRPNHYITNIRPKPQRRLRAI